ncbi:MAG: Bifunctional glutamine synthetase adenylyltransferase/adenylyl-removing enzyme [Verrucomicrobiae bacterium]|nr:Bifunctional glutamine synthetase adenylyltransferase/adenylyl-removing enzyme [Verrucomicrobiae bacterium]
MKRPLSSLIAKRPPAPTTAQQLLRAHGFRDPARVHSALTRLHSDELQRASLAKIFNHLLRACAAAADGDRAVINFERLVAALPNPSMFYHYLQAAPDRLDLLVKVFAHSQALADTLAGNAEYFHFLIAPETLKAPRTKKWLAAELARVLLPLRLPAAQYDAIRQFRRRETLRIGTRDLTGCATVEETIRELANLADVCLQAVYEIALQKLCSEFKVPDSRFAVIGMGKLGGQELNYSSDVDVIFVYDEEAQLTPTLTRHEFCTKLAEEIVRVVGAKSAAGTLFRIDLRLRPEGASGPLVRSLESCENYYAEWGETWERMALIKARGVAGDAALGDEFVQMVQPFVYSRHAGSQVIQQMAVIKQRIETEVVRADRLTRHVKLGVGGIREIEFIVQSFQVLRGGHNPALRHRSTLAALPLLVKAKLLREAEARTLAEAYRFLRNVEHRLQMEMELQTHTIPDEDHAQYRLARAMGFATVAEFQARQNSHTGAVRRIYQAVLADAEETAPPALPTAGQLSKAGFADGEAAVRILLELGHGTGVGHVAPRTQELVARLTPVILGAATLVADPDVALARFAKFVSAYGSRGLLFELLARHPQLVEMLLRLGDASKFFAETLAQQPDLFDEVCRGAAVDEPQPFVAGTDVRLWKRAELLRIGIADVLGVADLERVHGELTNLAEGCLQLALAQARRELKLKKLPFAIIGLGKLGGQELGYGADLDVLFVGETVAGTKLAAAVIELMARATDAGKLFVVDARLRPDGKDGPLTSPVAAHRDYYRQRGETWERQALTKARVVAGDAAIGAEFMRVAQAWVYGAALTPREAGEIRAMRARIETERTDQPLKTGPGGLMDVEFLVQALQLRHGAAHAPLRTAHTLAALNRLTALGLVEETDAIQLRQHYLFLRRVESVLRRVENTSVARLPADEVEQGQLARRLGLPTAAAFRAKFESVTAQVRALFERLWPVD